MILLDSNVLLYATGSDHPLRGPSRAILTAVGRATVEAHITDVVLMEFVYARARRAGREQAVRLARDIVDTVTSVLPLSDQARARALTLYARTTRLSINDSYIAAAALENGLDLVSADQDFVEVSGLVLISPDSEEAAGLR